MPNSALTDLAIRSLKAEKQTDFWDTKTPAFGIRVGPRSKTFIAKIGNARRAIGSYPDMSLQEARRRFLALKSEKPSSKGQTTFIQAYNAFKELHVSQKRARTQKDYLRILDVHYLPAFRAMHLDDIEHRNIADITDKLIHTPSERSHTIAVGRTFFKFCVRRRYIATSPLDGVQLPKPVARDRVLTDDELKAIWHATKSCGTFGKIVQLLILTGQRVGEISKLQASWINENQIVFPKEITKNGREHTLPIGKLATSLLSHALDTRNTGILFPARGQPNLPFSGFSKSKDALDKILSLNGSWTLHDLRRTFATNMARLGVRLEITERLLNHVSGSLGGIVGVYQKWDFQPEMREAIERYESWFLQLITPDPSRHT